ncbi:MAG: ATP-binding protein, partial [Mycetocola sp.]
MNSSHGLVQYPIGDRHGQPGVRIFSDGPPEPRPTHSSPPWVSMTLRDVDPPASGSTSESVMGAPLPIDHIRASQPRREQLWGRESELSQLAAFFARGTTTGGSLVIVGEPGVGKTALLTHAARTAAELFHARQLRGAGFEFEAKLSFAGLHQLMLPVIHTLVDVADPHRSVLSTALGMNLGDPPDHIMLTTSLLVWLHQLS